jgi:hypothetical protein
VAKTACLRSYCGDARRRDRIAVGDRSQRIVCCTRLLFVKNSPLYRRVRTHPLLNTVIQRVSIV